MLVAFLAASNVANNRLLDAGHLPARLAEIAVLLGFARWFGLTRADLGLGRWGSGLRWGGVAFGAVAVGYAIGLAIPLTRSAFLDRRADLGLADAVWTATVPVLVGTVLLEELAFRGVLWGLLCRLRGETFATLGSSVLFGFWHVLPAMHLTVHNRAAEEVLGGGATPAAVVFGVAFTALAGVVFAELRRRSGSLLAPVGLHWATNGLGYVLSAAVQTG